MATMHSLRMRCFELNDKLIHMEKICKSLIYAGDPKPYRIAEWKKACKEAIESPEASHSKCSLHKPADRADMEDGR